MITAEITLREALSGNKEGLLSSPPPLGFCFLLCWQNKPMKYEYFPSDKPLSKRSCSAGMTLTPGGGNTVSCFIRSWRILIGHDGTDEALEQRNINPSTRIGIFKCERFTSFTRVENFIILPLGVFKD